MRAAMILCAGLGTRLRPLTDWLAKPMVPVGDAPAVGHVASRLRASGVERLVVNVHHRPDDLRAWAAGTGAAISEEAELLGTAGGVARAAPLLGDGDVLVWNGDILSDLDPRALERAHAASGAAATLAVVARAAGEGNVGLGEGGRIVRLRREAFGDERAGADFVGVHVVGAGLRASLPERGCLVGDVYLPALRAGARLASHAVTSAFVDVGSLAAYVDANRAWLAARGASSWAAPDARVSASVDGSIVGAGSVVEAAALRCVVWPGTHVREPVADAVVTPHGVARLPS
ncbi:MAG: NTP transferase domain-containing protein [Labilithrix sp.]|nr:NTP transferase domain-containing protein [Labilithrix sp.]